MEVMDTPSREEFIHCYAPTVHRLPSIDSGTTQGGNDFYNKTQGNVDRNPQKSWVDSTEPVPHTNVLSVGETVGRNGEAERKIFLYKSFLLEIQQ
jgi:hypothetical protein